MSQPFSIKERIKSIGFALDGLKTMFLEEHNARIHLVGMLLGVGFGFWLDISSLEWAAISICIGLVFAAELFNSSLESMANHVSPEWHEDIKKVKDYAAAAVLVMAITAIVVGLIIYLPKILALI